MFKIGQKVWCVMFGEGSVTKILTNSTRYPLVVKFRDEAVEYYSLDGKYMAMAPTQTLFPHPVEIVKKIVKPSINWGHVRDEYKFLAQDANGDAWLYWEKPELRQVGWGETRGASAEANSYASYTPGTCNWKDSLIKRPD